MTTLRGQILDQHSDKGPYRYSFVPVHPTPAAPDHSLVLFLENGVTMPREGYVKTRRKLSIPWAWMEDIDRVCGGGRDYKLTETSFKAMLAHARRKHGDIQRTPPPPTAALPFTPGHFFDSHQPHTVWAPPIPAQPTVIARSHEPSMNLPGQYSQTTYPTAARSVRQTSLQNNMPNYGAVWQVPFPNNMRTYGAVGGFPANRSPHDEISAACWKLAVLYLVLFLVVFVVCFFGWTWVSGRLS